MARTGQVCLNKGVQVVFRAVPNEGPMAERVCIHIRHEQERFTFELFAFETSRNARDAASMANAAALSACAMRFLMSGGANFSTCDACELPWVRS